MRTLRLTSPLTKGEDVKVLQKAINARQAARSRPRIIVDGECGPATINAASSLGYLLGAQKSTFERNYLTIGLQRMIIHPKSRTPLQLVRARNRKKYLEEEAKRSTPQKRVVKAAYSFVGVTEHPAGSNRGPVVSKFQKPFGVDGVFWCGAFVGYLLREYGGIPVNSRILYVPYIISDAKNGTNGFKKTVPLQDIQPGDVLCFDFGVSSDTGEHVGIAVSRPVNGMVETIEGNTSSGSAGSQSNGGGVFHRSRPLSSIVAACRY